MNYRHLATAYKVVKKPNYSRTTKYGTTQEDAYHFISYFYNTSLGGIKGASVLDELSDRTQITYFPDYDIYMTIRYGFASWEIPTITIYAKTESKYKKFQQSVIKPALDKLWRN